MENIRGGETGWIRETSVTGVDVRLEGCMNGETVGLEKVPGRRMKSC